MGVDIFLEKSFGGVGIPVPNAISPAHDDDEHSHNKAGITPVDFPSFDPSALIDFFEEPIVKTIKKKKKEKKRKK